MATKRKLTNVSLETKYKAIMEVADMKPGVTKTSIAKKFGVPSNTLSTWLKEDNKKKIIASFEASSFRPDAKKMRTAKYQDVEEALDIWFREARAANIAISGPVLQAKADELSKKLGHTDFACSNGWLERFKTRKGYHFRSIIGEAKSVKPEAVEAWKTSTLPTLLEDYSPDDIYNADETGLFWRMQPNKSLVLQGDDGRGTKVSKERVTILPCANMSGTDKLELLIIGKSKQPHCLRGLKSYPVTWRNNPTAWMTGPLFTEWLQKLDRRMVREKRKIALVIDNCRAHPKVDGLKAVKLVWLPPNTTSITQPMDQGIIANLKHHYRNRIVKDGLLKSMEKGDDFRWNILDMMYALRSAWGSVKPSTIARSFGHCGFQSQPVADPTPEPQPGSSAADPAPAPEEDEDPDDNIPLAELARQLTEAGHATTEEDLHLWMDVDSNLPTTAQMTLEDIVDEVHSNQAVLKARLTETESDLEDDPEDPEDPDPQPITLPANHTFQGAKDAFRYLQTYFLKRPDNQRLLEAFLDPLSKELDATRTSTQRQATMKDFFM